MTTESKTEQHQLRETGPTTSRGRETRARLVAGARRVFEQKGYEQARIADFGVESGVATGTFYTYFPSKEAVFREIASDVVREMYDAMHAASPEGTVWDVVYQTHQRFVQSYRENADFIALIHARSVDIPFMRELRLRLREGFIGPGARAVARFQSEGLADRDLDPRLTIEVVAAMGDELCFQWFVLGRALADEETMVTLLTRLWLRAIGVPLEHMRTH